MSNVPDVISHTGERSCKYTVPGLREHPNSISPALTLAPWFVSLRHRPMRSVFSGCKDHQNEMHGGSTEVNRKGCLYSITPTTHPDTQRCPCPSRSHPKGLPGLWISLNVSLYSWETEPREGVTPLKSHTASLNCSGTKARTSPHRYPSRGDVRQGRLSTECTCQISFHVCPAPGSTCPGVEWGQIDFPNGVWCLEA